MSITGKSKQNSSACNDIHEEFIKEVINHKERLPEKKYEFFGSNDNVKNLELFIKHNPFMASALSIVDGHLMIVSYIKADAVDAVDAADEGGWFERIVDLLDDSYPRVDATFSSDTLEVMRLYKVHSNLHMLLDMINI